MKSLILFALLAAVPAAPDEAPPPRPAAPAHLTQLNIPEAHKSATGKCAVVAVIDSGVKELHADLKGRAKLVWDVPANGGEDDVGHGTWVVGVLLGAAPDAEVRVYKIGSAAGRTNPLLVAVAVDAAVLEGAQVVNLSLGMYAKRPGLDVLKAAVKRAVDAGVVVVAAAGNGYGVRGVAFPAALAGVVAVGAVDGADEPAAFSDPGPEILVAAPGVGVPGPGGAFNGTSGSSPLVAGLAALYVGKTGAGAGFREALVASCRDVHTPGRDDETGHGVPDAVKLLEGK